jgi:outer membrane protein assembly factor BamA
MPSGSQIVSLLLMLLFSSGLPSISFAHASSSTEVSTACGNKVFRIEVNGDKAFTTRELKRMIYCTSPPPWFDEPSGLDTKALADAMETFFSANTLTDGTEEFVSTDVLFNSASAFLSDNELSDGILAFFYDHGFLDVKIGEPQIGPDDQVTIAIEEGPRYRVGTIAIEGETVFSRSELESRLKMKRGEPFRGSGLQRDVLALTDFYSDRGYAWVNVDPRTRIEWKRHLVDAHFVITPGQQVRIGRITISGNATTHADVIRRALKIHEHQLYNEKAIRESKAQLDGLGVFDSTKITTNPSAKSDEVDVNFIVVEKSSRKISPN